MIPEPASAQRRLDEWVIDQITLECHAASAATSSLLSRLIENPAHDGEILSCIGELLTNSSHIGAHLGWPRWNQVCSRAQSVLGRCSTDAGVRAWVGQLFEYNPHNTPPADLLSRCPGWGKTDRVPQVETASPEITRHGWPEEGEHEAISSEGAPLEDSRAELPETDHHAPVLHQPIPMVVFKSVGALRAIRASMVDRVVRKEKPAPTSGSDPSRQTITDGVNALNRPVESTPSTPDRFLSDRFEIVLRHEHAGLRITARSCLGVHWVPASLVAEMSQSDAPEPHVLVAGVGSARLCGGEEIKSMVV